MIVIGKAKYRVGGAEEVSLGVRAKEAHTGGSIFQIGIREKRSLTHAGRADHQRCPLNSVKRLSPQILYCAYSYNEQRRVHPFR